MISLFLSLLNFPPYLFIPLATALGYTFAALMLKRSLAFGVGPIRSAFVCNIACAVLFIPLWFLGSGPTEWSNIHQPLLPAITFLAGQIFTLLALTRGDVSVVTPIFGTKVILVALFSVPVLGEMIPQSWWAGAVLATVAILLINDPPQAHLQRNRAISAAFAIASAALFALTDVFVEKWTPAWGAARFIPLMFGLMGLLSFGLIPLFSAPLTFISKAGWKWLLPASIILAVQAMGMAIALGHFGGATAVNIVYSTRGLWSVVLVWVIGHWFANEERKAGRSVLIRRLLGSAILIIAILLI